jgi:alanine dehydrogenase
LDECIRAVEAAFRLRGEGEIPPAGILGFPVEAGGFHVKAARMGRYFAAKVNANFPGNRERFDMPTIQGVVLLADAESGYPLALLDSIEITIRRTGAATAVAAKHLAREDARAAGICGCGSQGRIQLEALTRVRPIERALAWDLDADAARRFAAEMSEKLGIPVEAAGEPADTARGSDIVVTCTPSKKPFLAAGDFRPGTFVSAVGADGPDKQELDPKLLSRARVVVDSLDQCASIGELHHALDAGVMTESDVYAELSDLAAGRKPGRQSHDEITLFDSTGTALQDVAAAVAVFERVSGGNSHRILDFGK